MHESRNHERSPCGGLEETVDDCDPGEPIASVAMGLDDVAEVAELERICFEDPWSRSSFAAELTASPMSWCRVLRIGARLAAYMVVWFVEDAAHLANLAVVPWARRQGLAQMMLDTLYEEVYLRGGRMIILEVRVSNDAAVRLYERNGFVTGGTQRNYYSHPREDALVMVRSLWLRETRA